MLTTNARSETIASYKSALARWHCLTPVSAFYERTGERTSKTKQQFTLSEAEWFCFAGILNQAETADGSIENYVLTMLPFDPAFENYYDRPLLVMERSDCAAWLDMSGQRHCPIQGAAAKILSTRFLEEGDAGAVVLDLYCKHGMSSAAFYAWESRYNGLKLSDGKRLQGLDEEHSKLQRLPTEAILDNVGLKDLLAKWRCLRCLPTDCVGRTSGNSARR